VRGHRTELPPEEITEDEVADNPQVNLLIVIPVTLAVAMLLSFTVLKVTKKKK
jgi:hypothetical protein